MKIINMIDLFAGIGGIRKGFEDTGHFKTVFSNDFDPFCKIIYDKNFDDAKLTVKDICKVSIAGDNIPKFDFVLSGFPCQPFSQGGLKQGLNDHKGRGVLFKEIIRLLQEAKDKYGKMPRGFLLENVKNLKTHDGGNTYKVIYDELTVLGYHIKDRIYNSLGFGVAQNRERIYIVGFRDKKDYDAFIWPEPTVTIDGYAHVKDFLDPTVDAKYYYNGKPLYEKISQYVTDSSLVYNYRRTYIRAMKGGYSPTLIASMGMGGHNVPIVRDSKGIRRLTPKECAKLQGFYDLYIPLDLADAHIYKQIGNSVTVPVIKAIAKQIVKAIDKH
jgi:DNA (cytosine-5)-methyltransferase 1